MERVLAKLTAGKPVTIVTVGDSLTDTNHWANRKVSWPARLKERLREKYKSEVTLVNNEMYFDRVKNSLRYKGRDTDVKTNRSTVGVTKWGWIHTYGGKLVEWSAAETTRTLADGLRTQSLGERNFAHVMRFVDGIVTVSEDEIRTALRVILGATSLIAEPSGAVTLAAALFHVKELPGARKVVVILSGGNLDPGLKAELLAARG